MIRALSLAFALMAAPAAAPESAWQRHASPVMDDLHNAFFVDDSKGWILAHQSGAVLHTTDGGASWKVQARLGEGFLESIYFLDARTGWICGDKGRLYRTADAGASWEDRSLKKGELSLYSVRFLDARRGFLAGVDTAAGKAVLFETSDGGAAWTRREDLPAPQGLRGLTDSLAFSSPSTGFAGGFNAILATRDGGRTWKVAHEVQGVVRDVFFLDGRTGWAVGHSGLVLGTKNGGEAWEALPPFSRNRLRSVFFLDAKRGWIVGDATEADAGVLFETTDGGAVWNRVEIKTPDLHRFAKSPGRLWIVGKGGTVLSRRLSG